MKILILGDMRITGDSSREVGVYSQVSWTCEVRTYSQYPLQGLSLYYHEPRAFFKSPTSLFENMDV